MKKAAANIHVHTFLRNCKIVFQNHRTFYILIRGAIVVRGGPGWEFLYAGRILCGLNELPVPKEEAPGFYINLPRCGAEGQEEGLVRVKICQWANVMDVELGSLRFTPDVWLVAEKCHIF